jgi:hypothetical protein
MPVFLFIVIFILSVFILTLPRVISPSTPATPGPSRNSSLQDSSAFLARPAPRLLARLHHLRRGSAQHSREALRRIPCLFRLGLSSSTRACGGRSRSPGRGSSCLIGRVVTVAGVSVTPNILLLLSSRVGKNLWFKGRSFGGAAAFRSHVDFPLCWTNVTGTGAGPLLFRSAKHDLKPVAHRAHILF